MLNSGELAWWQKPLRIIRYDPLNDFSRYLNGDYAEHAREVRRVCHANCEWVMANGGSSPGTADIVNFDTPHFGKNRTVGDRDILRDYLPHARAEGIRVVAYINLHWFSYAFAEKHPGWEQLVADGTAYGRKTPLYGNGTTCCVNTPWREWAYLLIREAMATGIDGVFLDGPAVFPGACYCKVCRAAFTERTGIGQAPEEEDWSDLWVAWSDFREWSMEQFLAGAKQAVQSVNPEGIVYCNAGGYQLSTRVARNPWRLEHHQQMTGAEVFAHYGVRDEDMHDTVLMAKFLSAGKNPAIVFSNHAAGGWHYVGLGESELGREFYQTAAGGASPWIAVYLPALEHQKHKTLAPVTAGWGRLEIFERYLTGDRSAARVALLRSDATALSYRSVLEVIRTRAGAAKEQDLIASAASTRNDDPVALKRFCEELTLEEFRGFGDLLTRMHLPFTVIRDQDCTAERLADFDCVVLPNAACLSEVVIGALERFVESGGSVVSSFETGWYDQRGTLRAAGTGGLGVPVPQKLGAFKPASYEEYAIFDEGLAYGPVRGDRMRRFEAGELIPRPEYALEVEVPSGATAVARYLAPIGLHYRPPQGESDFPLLVRGRRGKGMWWHLTGAPGRDWRKYRVPAWEYLFRGVLSAAVGSLRQIETDAPPTVEIELRRRVEGSTSQLLVHLINNTADGIYPIQETIPVKPFALSVRCETPVRVFEADTLRPVSYTAKPGRIEMRVEMSHHYVIYVIEESGA